jgi:hypothetical protein
MIRCSMHQSTPVDAAAPCSNASPPFNLTPVHMQPPHYTPRVPDTTLTCLLYAHVYCRSVPSCNLALCRPVNKITSYYAPLAGRMATKMCRGFLGFALPTKLGLQLNRQLPGRSH